MPRAPLRPTYRQCGAGRVGAGDGYTGGYWGGLYRYPASTKGPNTLSGADPSEAGPGSPSGAGVGGDLHSAPRARPPASGPPWASPRPAPCGRCPAVGSCRPIPASWPIRARIDYILLKVSQNPEVSPKNVEKACHSPNIQNGSQKSPLDILRFTFSSAFSHKELMAHFDR